MPRYTVKNTHEAGYPVSDVCIFGSKPQLPVVAFDPQEGYIEVSVDDENGMPIINTDTDTYLTARIDGPVTCKWGNGEPTDA